ncbi:hypothetical protein EDD17DRAFT_702507 [Pisolithus thermaeus]|nr:hypothetical protein EDD17DRAFT_702507 [Pisolithus thermaeus]
MVGLSASILGQSLSFDKLDRKAGWWSFPEEYCRSFNVHVTRRKLWSSLAPVSGERIFADILHSSWKTRKEEGRTTPLLAHHRHRRQPASSRTSLQTCLLLDTRPTPSSLHPCLVTLRLVSESGGHPPSYVRQNILYRIYRTLRSLWHLAIRMNSLRGLPQIPQGYPPTPHTPGSPLSRVHSASRPSQTEVLSPQTHQSQIYLGHRLHSMRCSFRNVPSSTAECV